MVFRAINGYFRMSLRKYCDKRLKLTKAQRKNIS
jgi:hypothetical protein